MIEIVKNNNGVHVVITGQEFIKENIKFLSLIVFGLDERLKDFSLEEQENIKKQAKDQALLYAKVRDFHK